MANNPTNYSADLPRVSSIVEHIYPFHGESKDRFHGWLEKNDISLAWYMKEASEWGTYVHKAMEDYGATWKWRWKKYKKIVDSWIQFHKDYDLKLIWSEVYIKCKDYQGTLDRLATINWVEWLIDWKSYWLAKAKFWLPNVYRKPYDKLKKARLQLSLYNRALKYKYRLAVVELTEDGYYFHELVQLPKEELDEILFLYKNSYIDQL